MLESKISILFLEVLNVLAIELDREIECSCDSECVQQRKLRLKKVVQLINEINKPEIDSQKENIS